MRDLALLATILTCLPMAFRHPFAGLYLWEWTGLMSPHRLTYGFAQELPFNFVIGAVTVAAMLMARGRKVFAVSGFTVLLVLFSAWITITTLLAPVPEVSNPLWSRTIKTMLMIFLIPALLTTKNRLHGFVWVVAISLGFYGVKGGGFTIISGGNYIVYGPENTTIGDNNSLALALTMTIPILNYLRLHTQHVWVRMGLLGVMLLTLTSVLGSYSRGGLIALTSMLSYLWLKSRSKALTLIVTAATLTTIFLLMPQRYVDRISSISQYDADESMRGRVEAWEVAWHVALDEPFGAGFDGPRQPGVWRKYLPEVQSRASHSIYFMVLGEHGFIGLAIYLAMGFVGWLNLSRIVALSRKIPELTWSHDMALALKVAMVGFLVGGAALPMAYYDGYLTLLALSVALRRVVEEERDLGRQATPLSSPILASSHSSKLTTGRLNY